MQALPTPPLPSPRAEAYIRATGAFLPGPAIGNDEIEDYLGTVRGRRSRAKALALRQNGIVSRHYALSRQGQPLFSSAQLAARAVQAAFEEHAEVRLADTDFLAVAGSFGDRLLPGLASPVQRELGLKPIEIASFQSVCGSAAMALQAACLQVRAGDKRQAVVAGSEFVSRILRGSYLAPTRLADDERGITDLGVDMLRWTLSDGAGAAVLMPAPARTGISLRVDWIDLVSYADRFDVCMQMGMADAGGTARSWADFDNPVEAALAGSFALQQDFRTLRDLFPVWVDRLRTLMDRQAFGPDAVDWYLCHFSSYALGREVADVMRRKHCLIDEHKWFSNLREQGNTGAASIFVMLDGFVRSGRPQSGQKVLLCIPESGWGLVAHAMLTVV